MLSPLMELEDWVLDVRWLFGDNHSLLCVAVAHNSSLLLDVTSGDVVIQRCCTEGCLLYSALLLVHESWADTVFIGGTVFNQLILWKPGRGSNTSVDKAPVERRLLGHNGVIFSICYLQDKGWLASASDDRSVRVWDVGILGGRGGKCGHSRPSCLRVLYGHQARVFSVCLSGGKVFSAGEDGACFIWDSAGGGKVVRKLKGHRAGGVRALAVSQGSADGERWVATGGADGAVRLWMVGGREEGKERTEEQLTGRLSDLGFSGQGLPKVVCGAQGEDGSASWSRRKLVVCTDRGVVYQYSDMQWEVIWQGSPEFQSYCVMDTVSVKDEVSAEEVCLCAVGNLRGLVQVFPLSQPDGGILLRGGSGKIHSLIWRKAKQNVYLLASGAEGHVFRWSVKVTLDENCVPALHVDPLPSFLLPPCAKRWLTAAVCLHSRSHGVLWVCGDRRGSLLLFQEDTTQDQEAAAEPALHPLSCLFGVHGKQGVTSVCEHEGALYSTGRDGCVRVFRVRPRPVENKGGLQLEVLRFQRACKGMEWLERVLILETGVWEEEEEESEEGEQSEKVEREARFVIAGFQADHFVVWDPVRQERLLAVPCGGGHRSWSLWPSDKGVWPGYGVLVFIKHGAVLASHPPAEALNSGKMGRSEGWSLREGLHGRGIGCVCRMGWITPVSHVGRDRPMDEGHWEIVVTGGDDTSLTVLAVLPSCGRVRVLSVITDHISSVRTLTVIRRLEEGGKEQLLSAFLVSAGGRAQIQCYRLLVSLDGHRRVPTCQVIQVAAHRLDQQWERRRNRHKTVKMDPETRQVGADQVEMRRIEERV